MAKKKSRRKKLEDKLDEVTSKIVRVRDKRCVICGSTRRLQCSHLFKRGRRSVRYDLDNCNANCNGCNLRHNNYPEFYTSWWLEKHSLDAYNKLLKRSNETWKPTLDELENLLTDYTKLLKTYL